MAESAQVENISFSHHAIIDWVLSNPDQNLSECAKTFGYTQPWLSTIIHSDAFKTEFARRRNMLDEHMAMGIQRKMAEVSKKALDKIEEMLDGGEEMDPRLVLDIADKTLHRQGYAPSRNGINIYNQQNNVIPLSGPVDRTLLQEARNIMKAIAGEAIEVKALPNASPSESG